MLVYKAGKQRKEKEATDKHIAKLKKMCNDNLTQAFSSYTQPPAPSPPHTPVSSLKYFLASPLVAPLAAVNSANLWCSTHTRTHVCIYTHTTHTHTQPLSPLVVMLCNHCAPSSMCTDKALMSSHITHTCTHTLFVKIRT